MAVGNGLNTSTEGEVVRTSLGVPASTNFAGDPNGSVAGRLGDFVTDSTDSNALYYCTTAGNAADAVWSAVGGGVAGPIVAGSGTDSAQGGTSNAINDYAFAFGSASQAGGVGSFAFGNATVSAGEYCFGFGINGVTSGQDGGFDYNFAFGNGAAAQGNYGFSFGLNSSTGAFNHAFAFGDGSGAQANYAWAIGNGANATAIGSFCFGNSGGTGALSSIGEYSFAFGNATAGILQAVGNYSFAFGDATSASLQANGVSSFAFGKAVIAQSNYSFAVGLGSSTYGQFAFAFGDSAYVGTDSDYCFAFGTSASSGEGSTYCFSFGNTATAGDGGSYNFSFGSDATTTNGGAYSFAFGKGSQTSTGPTSTVGAFCFGESSSAMGDGSFSFGKFATASSYSLAFGYQVSTSSGLYSFAFGDGTESGISLSGNYSFAFGKATGAVPATVSGDYSFGFGADFSVTNSGSWVVNDGVLTGNNDTAAGQMNLSFTNGYRLFGGSLNVNTVGSGLAVAEGSNAKQGVVTLVGGVGAVTNTSVTANSRIFCFPQDSNTTGFLTMSVITPGSGFIVDSSVPTDTGVVAYQIFEPAV